ncbi:MAG: branched-chain amino acid ABC transporter permease [Desulfobacterales bacterium]
MFNIEIILQQLFYGLVLGSNYVLIAAGFSLIWGVVGVLNLSHGEFFMLGAYASYYVFKYIGGGFFPAIILSMVFIFFIGILFEKITIAPLRKRTKLDYEMSTLMMTIGISIFLQNFVLIVFGPKYKGIPAYFDGIIRLGPIIMSYDRLAIFIVALILIFLLLFLFKHTRIGLAMRAVSENPDGAALAGISINRVLYIAFGLSTALAAAGGGLLIPIYNAYPTVGANIILLAFSIVIFGGLGSVKGAVYAGFLVGVLESFTVLYISSSWKDVIVFLTVIVVLTFRPRGLMGLKEA